MNVLVYMPRISRKSGGVFQYSCLLLDNLLALRDINVFVYYLGDDPQVCEIAERAANICVIRDQESFLLRLRKKIIAGLNLIAKKSGKFWIPPNLVKAIINKYNIDLVHYPNINAFEGLDAPQISTVHDVQEIHLPENFTPAERASRASTNEKVMRVASHIVVSYNHVKKDIIKFFGKDPATIDVCLLNMSFLWFVKFEQTENLPLDDYIFYPAATWPHKNHVRLIEALAWVREEYAVDLKLVLTGQQKSGWDAIHERIQALGLKGQVMFRGIVNEQQLYNIYHSVRAVIVPTLYEAGSFPLMESMIMGIPVVCARTTSLPETIGDESFVFDPLSIEDMGRKIYQICYDNGFRERNITNSKAAKRRLIERKTSEELLNIYRKTLKKKKS